ncbi:bifunctional hydroxymethylpyrimidine kinase/phosphomethylpyrimidine kinase [Aquabacterium sp.]|uniref:bifunctional hydroxymethylpyrimidine kinase/phosphomethylpyrimidine kinase n=1 Tax=Aquabacterium sp. TaxID=1872578 RepID=UPI0025C6D870|nr:bifunctional hydroxymethylpyrimidine kinase/phosphomethylpyrimidine kinase [Aquabacterium sp.]
MNTPTDGPQVDPATEAEDSGSPACVMSFNASDPSGASGIAADIATMASMGAHTLPVITSLLIRDTAEVFEIHEIDADAISEQARTILEDATISAWKVGFLGSAEGVSVVAEILSDYTDIPLVSYLPNVSWMEEDAQMSYLEAFRELILPATLVLVGNHKTLTDFLLPEWESERPPSARELAVAASESGCGYVLVTGIQLPDQFIDNVLASAQGAIAGERFERFEASFVGAGDTLSAALAAILATETSVDMAVSEALSFLDQALDSGFRPGMGGVIPDRFFWALPPGEGGEETEGEGESSADEPGLTDNDISPSSRNVH